MTTEIIFKIIPHASKEYEKAVALRNDNLRKPLGLALSSEELDQEKNDIHIVGMIENEVVATSLLVPQGAICQMRQVAIRNVFQKQGIGSEMVLFCESIAKKFGFNEIYCHARDVAIHFYLKNGFIPEGEFFEEHSIPHLKMRKFLK